MEKQEMKVTRVGGKENLRNSGDNRTVRYLWKQHLNPLKQAKRKD